MKTSINTDGFKKKMPVVKTSLNEKSFQNTSEGRDENYSQITILYLQLPKHDFKDSFSMVAKESMVIGYVSENTMHTIISVLENATCKQLSMNSHLWK